MSVENLSPRIYIKTSSGGGWCPQGYCNINVQNQFATTSKYLLLRGTIGVQYNGEERTLIDSPYVNSGWAEYVDAWRYDTSVEVTSGDPTALFVQVSLKSQDTTENVPFNVQVYNLSNETIVKTSKSPSWIMVKGESFTLDGVEKGDSGIIQILQERDIIISSTGSCKVLYIEKA